MKSLERLRLAGAALAIVGSFLPWEAEGDFMWYQTYGIKLGDPFPSQLYGNKLLPMASDYGGALVILLTMTILLLAYRPPRIIKNPGLWKLIISALLMAAALFFVVRWLVHLFEYPAGGIGAPQLEIGLIGVVAGSALLLGVAIRNYRAV